MLTSLFKTMPKPAAGWRDPVLARLLDAQRKNGDNLAARERAWHEIEDRGDIAADQRREQLRAELPPLYQQRDLLMLLISAAEERQTTITRELMPLYEQKRGALEGAFERLSIAVEVPSDAAFVAFARLNREVEQLRSVLSDLTRASEYRREWDAVLALKSTWHDQQQERARLFDRLLAPGMRPRGEAAWQGTLRRLAELGNCLKGVSNDAR